MKPCERCGHIPKRKFVKSAGCPKCHYKPPTFRERLNRAIEAFKAEPGDYRPRKKREFIVIGEVTMETTNIGPELPHTLTDPRD